MVGSQLRSDGERWLFDRRLREHEKGVIDDRHSVVYDYLLGQVIRYQYIKGDGSNAVSEFGS